MIEDLCMVLCAILWEHWTSYSFRRTSPIAPRPSHSFRRTSPVDTSSLSRIVLNWKNSPRGEKAGHWPMGPHLIHTNLVKHLIYTNLVNYYFSCVHFSIFSVENLISTNLVNYYRYNSLRFFCAHHSKTRYNRHMIDEARSLHHRSGI